MMNMTTKFRFRRVLSTIIAVLVVYGCIQLLMPFEVDRNILRQEIKKVVEASRQEPGLIRGQTCRQPQLNLYNPEIMQYLTVSDPIDCGPVEDWVEVHGSTAHISDSIHDRFTDTKCWFTDIMREDDYGNTDGVSTATRTNFHFEKSDFVKVNCRSESGETWKSTMAGIRYNQSIHDRVSWEALPSDALHLNVLMFGFDSLSRNMFIRKLPKTDDYIQNTLHGITLEGYNIVGDGTPQALIPILTGNTELELPDTRRRMWSGTNYVNVYPFIWNDFQKNGYVTGFAEDCPSTGTFTYRLKGFKEMPTDHYMRPFYLETESDSSSYRDYCTGSLPRHKIMMNYITDFFRVYHDAPKFMFGFHGELSHDAVNLIGGADDDMLDWLKTLRDEGHLDNTLLILMSDHGGRFTSIRNTLQGKQEERLPFFTFVFPPSFQQSHPSVVDNFRKNVGRLSTPFDIHATLSGVLHFPGTGLGSLDNRSIPLFQEIPIERSCADAFIEPHWCACLSWQEVDLLNPLVKRASEELIQHINRYTNEHRDICEELKVQEVQWAAELLPTQGLLHFRKNKDSDGFVGDMSDTTKISEKIFQVKVMAEPSGGLFEASVTYRVATDTFSVQISDISRINRYGSAAHCVYENLEQLRKYCYCKEAPPDGQQIN